MIAVGSDHVGLELKKNIIAYLEGKGVLCKDMGPFAEERCNYPDYALAVAKEITEGECDRGILLCGTGVGMSIAANKIAGIRCVCCSEPFSAMMSRRHNNTNVLALGSRVIGMELAKMIVDCWLEAEYEGGRHEIRLEQIAKLEG